MLEDKLYEETDYICFVHHCVSVLIIVPDHS